MRLAALMVRASAVPSWCRLGGGSRTSGTQPPAGNGVPSDARAGGMEQGPELRRLARLEPGHHPHLGQGMAGDGDIAAAAGGAQAVLDRDLNINAMLP
jgi:hypothetical protein